MKLLAKGSYHHGPANLHFESGIIEVDQAVATFLKRDAPDNFEDVIETDDDQAVASATDTETDDEALEAPTKDKQVNRGRGNKNK